MEGITRTLDLAYTIVYSIMIELKRTYEYDKWFKSLKDANAKARIAVRVSRLAHYGNFGDCESVGDGVYELRIHYGPGYRVYLSRRENEIVLLLIGGDKSSQRNDILKAKSLNRQYE